MCFNSKNLYNEVNYELRQQYIGSGKHMSYYEANSKYKTYENYKSCYSQPANCTLRLLFKNWKSFEVAVKDYEKYPAKYLGKPKLPKYLSKDGRYLWMIPNNSFCYDYEKSEIHFRVRALHGYQWRSRCLGRPIQVRFVPYGTCYIMEVVYEIELPDIEQHDSKRIVAIDLGVNNLITATNNIGERPIIVNGKPLKSINQFYNKREAYLKSVLSKRNQKYWSNKLDVIAFKRHRRVCDYMHKASSFIIKWCFRNNIDTLIIGENKKWKQKHQGMQNFKSIPYEMLKRQLEYKCRDAGINYMEVYEGYTSGTSFLDGEIPCKENYNISRRIGRGLFQASGKLINADVNASLQIMRKVFPDAYSYGIEVDLTPVVINVV